MKPQHRVLLSIAFACALIAAACGGGSSDDAAADDGTVVAGGQGGQQVIDQSVLDDAEERAAAAEDEGSDDAAEAELLTTDDVDEADLDADAAEDGDDDSIEVTESEDDPLDSMLNAVSEFQGCISDEGFEFIGAPGQGDAQPEDFEPDYMAALGKCATQTDILARFQAFGEAQANLTPEEIAANNFGLPIFKECMERLGWEVEDLVPDERGALGFGTGGTGLTPPEDSDAGILDVDDISTCRLEAQQYTEANYVAEDEAAEE